ncbi:MAG TPA: hypothetical protein VF590_07780 [Isosphaeraceae bacterium]|jgi:hypothetical protein
MPNETVPGTELEYYLIAFDAKGRERDVTSGPMRWRAMQALRNRPITDVFLMCHGWMGDEFEARRRYNAWFEAMASCRADVAGMGQARAGFLPLWIALYWPSRPWGDADPDAGAAPAGPTASESVEEVVQRCAAAIADTEEARRALRTIVAAAGGSAPPRLPPEVVAAYHALDRETGLGSGGEAAAPGDDREPFDPERAYRQAREEEAAHPGDSASGGLLAPLRALSFGVMKGLARQFGEGTAHRFLGDLRHAVDAGRDVRFHLMGHGFGGIVTSAMLAGPRTAALDLQVDSLTLAQATMSLWSFGGEVPGASGRAGYFRRILDEHRVGGPIVTTRSDADRAAGRWHPWAAGAAPDDPAPGRWPRYGALGACGARGPGVDAIDLPMPAGDGHVYGFRPGTVYNLDAGRFIARGDGPRGAHADIARPEVAHAVWEAARA